jgi:hypothetical protein
VTNDGDRVLNQIVSPSKFLKAAQNLFWNKICSSWFKFLVFRDTSGKTDMGAIQNIM